MLQYTYAYTYTYASNPYNYTSEGLWGSLQQVLDGHRYLFTQTYTPDSPPLRARRPPQ